MKYLMILCFIGAFVLAVVTTFEYLELENLRRDGRVTKGTLYSDQTLDTGKARRIHKVVLDYKPTDHPVYRKVFNLAESEFDKLLEIGSVSVTYLPSNPEVSVVGEDIKYDLETGATAMGFFVLGTVLALYYRKRHRALIKQVELRGEI